MKFATLAIVTLNLFGNYTLGIRKPPYFVIASGAKQSRAVCAHPGLLRSARNDGMTDAKVISPNLFQGQWPTPSTSAAPDERAGHGCPNKFRSEERMGGKECAITCRSRGYTHHEKK